MKREQVCQERIWRKGQQDVCLAEALVGRESVIIRRMTTTKERLALHWKEDKGTREEDSTQPSFQFVKESPRDLLHLESERIKKLLQGWLQGVRIHPSEDPSQARVHPKWGSIQGHGPSQASVHPRPGSIPSQGPSQARAHPKSGFIPCLGPSQVRVHPKPGSIPSPGPSQVRVHPKLLNLAELSKWCQI